MYKINETSEIENRIEFVKDTEGARLARMGLNTFRKLAEEFGAVYMVSDKLRITDWNKFKEGLEKYRLNKDDTEPKADFEGEE